MEGDEVERINSIKHWVGEKNWFPCGQCHKIFEIYRDLDHHVRKCRSAVTKRVIISKESGYKCDICLKSHSSLDAFKSHVFEDHSEIEVQAVYNRSVEAMIDNKQLGRLRSPIMTMISKDKFHSYVEFLLFKELQFSRKDLSFLFSYI